MPDHIETPRPSPLDTWNDHMAQEFVHCDVDAAMDTMTADPEIICVALAAGGRGRDAVRNFYARRFIGRTPADLQVEVLSRTTDGARIVDEMLISFTHDIDLPWLLPGIAPTGRKVTIAAVAIVSFRDGKIASEHLYWDQASVLVQIGRLSAHALPVVGAAQARALIDPDMPLNGPLDRALQR